MACILYEMCCMNHAFTGSNFLSIVLKIVEGDTPSLPKRYPRELNAIMERMLNKSPSLRPSAMEILKIPYIDEQLQIRNFDAENLPLVHLMCRYSEITLEDKNLNCQKEAAQIINAMQKKIHLQTLRALSEVQKMTPRERMRLRKLQAADEKAQKLKKLAEEKYEENNKRMQELRSRNSEQLTVDILHEFDDLTSENLPESQPIPSLDLDPLESSIEDHGMTYLGDHESDVCDMAGICSSPAQKRALCNEIEMQRHLECRVTASLEPPTEAHEIPEDPLVAEEYYTDAFDSCSEDSEEEEEEIVFSAPGEEVKDEGSRPAYRTFQ
ncbi:hypothetical protein GH733_002618, partial [Mirounga leonina]